jgi:2-keto-3-deoxy-L-rhamnonate aldolase RhmA
MYRNYLLERINEGRLVIGMFFVSANPTALEVIGKAGLDWVVIDMEHGPLDPLDQRPLMELVNVARAYKLTPIVRVPENNPVHIGKVLDAGAQGVVVPHVTDKESAMQAVAATRFPPRGIRGAGPLAASNQYVGNPGEYFGTDPDIVVLTSMEDQASIDNFDEISDVEGISWFRAGAWDLALSMGYDDPGHPAVQEARKHIYDTCRRKGLRVAESAHWPEKMQMHLEAGIRIFTVSDEPHMFYNACKAQVDGARAAVKGIEKTSKK